MRNTSFILILAVVLTSSCSGLHSKPTPGQALDSSIDAHDSSVDIVYVLGHNQHRLTAEAKNDTAKARSFLDRQVLTEGVVDMNKYTAFLKKALEFTSGPKPSSTQPDSCRTPFTVTVRLANQSRNTSGCRSSDEGALSKLVRDGEFLLYSKK